MVMRYVGVRVVKGMMDRGLTREGAGYSLPMYFLLPIAHVRGFSEGE